MNKLNLKTIMEDFDLLTTNYLVNLIHFLLIFLKKSTQILKTRKEKSF